MSGRQRFFWWARLKLIRRCCHTAWRFGCGGVFSASLNTSQPSAFHTVTDNVFIVPSVCFPVLPNWRFVLTEINR